MKLKLKPPGTQRLKLKCGKLLSTSAFKLNLRRYSTELGLSVVDNTLLVHACDSGVVLVLDILLTSEAEAHTRLLSSSTTHLYDGKGVLGRVFRGAQGFYTVFSVGV